MAEEIKPPTPANSITITKSKLISGVIAIVIFFVGVFYFVTREEKKGTTAKKEHTFNRDEPAQEQILQEDFKEKIHEMLDSGMSVGQISRETGVRRDVIRKIKKEKTGEDSE